MCNRKWGCRAFYCKSLNFFLNSVKFNSAVTSQLCSVVARSFLRVFYFPDFDWHDITIVILLVLVRFSFIKKYAIYLFILGSGVLYVLQLVIMKEFALPVMLLTYAAEREHSDSMKNADWLFQLFFRVLGSCPLAVEGLSRVVIAVLDRCDGWMWLDRHSFLSYLGKSKVRVFCLSCCGVHWRMSSSLF